jgi:hypothetical protein
MKIMASNWINVLGVFVVMLVYSVLFNQFNNDLDYNIFQSIVAGLISICLYGMMFWGLFVVSLIILDLLLIVWNQKYLRQKLLAEWLFVSSPFIFWGIKYEEWIIAIAIITFFITQCLRKGLIIKAMNV